MIKAGEVEDLRDMLTPETMAERAEEAAAVMASLANPKRLLICCHLAQGECSVSELAGLVGLGQSALSQHLAKLRHQGLILPRREAQLVYYRLASPAIQAILETLHKFYCRPA